MNFFLRILHELKHSFSITRPGFLKEKFKVCKFVISARSLKFFSFLFLFNTGVFSGMEKFVVNVIHALLSLRFEKQQVLRSSNFQSAAPLSTI